MQPFRRATHVIVTHDLDALDAHLLGRQSVSLPGKTRCEFLLDRSQEVARTQIRSVRRSAPRKNA